MARSRSTLGKLRTLSRVGLRQQALVAEAIAAMLRARIVVLLRPFPKVSKRFGEFVPPSDPRVTAHGVGATPEQAQIARDVGWAVAAAAPFMPFRSVCLQQAMAAHAMLRRRGIPCVMHFGAGKGDEKPIDAHAWLDAAGVKVTGYPVSPGMAELGCFV